MATFRHFWHCLIAGVQHLCTFNIGAPLFISFCKMFGRRSYTISASIFVDVPYWPTYSTDKFISCTVPGPLQWFFHFGEEIVIPWIHIGWVRWTFQNLPSPALQEVCDSSGVTPCIVMKNDVVYRHIRWVRWMFQNLPLPAAQEVHDSSGVTPCIVMKNDVVYRHIRWVRWMLQNLPLPAAQEVCDSSGVTPCIVMKNDVVYRHIRWVRWMLQNLPLPAAQEVHDSSGVTPCIVMKNDGVLYHQVLYIVISGEYGGCSRILHCQRHKRSMTAAVRLLALSWRMMGSVPPSVVFSWIHAIMISSPKWKNHCEGPGTTQEMNLSVL